MGWFEDMGKGIDGFFKGAGDFVGGIANGIGGIASTVAKTTFDMGKAAVDGVCQFGKGVGDFFGGWGQNIADGWNNGWARVDDGIKQMQAGAGFAGFMTAAGGTLHVITGGGLGFVECLNDEVKKAADTVYDDLGNATLVKKEDNNWFQNFLVDTHGGVMTEDYNTQHGIKDAIKAGDINRANAVMGDVCIKNGTKVLSGAALVAGIALAPVTGGGSAAAGVLVGTSLASGVSAMASGFMESKIKKDDLEFDVNRAVSSDIDEMIKSGRLNESDKDAYAQILAQYYNTESINGLGHVDFMEKSDIDRAAVGKGLLKDVQGNDISPDAVTSAYNEFLGHYQSSVDSGDISQDQANRLASLAALNHTGQIDDATYFSNMYAVQFENYDINAAQANALITANTQLALGAITNEQYASYLMTEPVLSEFVKSDGTFEVPPKSASESNSILSDFKNMSSRSDTIDLSNAVASKSNVIRPEVRDPMLEYLMSTSDMTAESSKNKDDKDDLDISDSVLCPV